MSNSSRQKDVVVRFLVKGTDSVRNKVADMNRELKNVDAAGKGTASSINRVTHASNQARDASGRFTKKLQETIPATDASGKKVGWFSSLIQKLGLSSDGTKGKINILSTAKKMLADRISTVNPKLGGLIEKFGGTAIKAGLVAAAITAVVMATNAMIKAGSQAEITMTKLGVIMHSEAAGMKAYEKAFQFSVVTPFEPQEVAEATAIAQGYLGQMGDAFSDNLFNMKGKMLETVKSMGPEMQATAKNMNGTVMELAADMASYSGQTIQEATTALMRADLALLDKYGAAGRKAYMAAKQVGELGTPEFLQAFVMNMRQVPEFIGMANKQSQTLSGLWSTIKGNIGAIPLYMSGVIEHGNGQITFWTRIKEIVGDISNGVGSLVERARPFLVQVGTLLGNIFGVVWNLGKTLYKVAEPLLKVFGFLAGGLLLAGLKLLNGLLNGVIWILHGVQDVTARIYSFIDKTFGVTEKIQAFYRWMEKASGFFQTMGILAKYIWDAVIDRIKYKLMDFFYNDPVGRVIFGLWNGEGFKAFSKDNPEKKVRDQEEYVESIRKGYETLYKEDRAKGGTGDTNQIRAQEKFYLDEKKKLDKLRRSSGARMELGKQLEERAIEQESRNRESTEVTSPQPRTRSGGGQGSSFQGQSRVTNNNQQSSTTVINNTNIYRPVRDRDLTDRSGLVPEGAF